MLVPPDSIVTYCGMLVARGLPTTKDWNHVACRRCASTVNAPNSTYVEQNEGFQERHQWEGRDR